MIVEIECLPDPPGNGGERYAHVEAAIAVIQRSGLNYEVGALGTTVEGPPDRLWPLVREVHEAALAAGAASVVSIVKVAETADPAAAPAMRDLTRKFARP